MILLIYSFLLTSVANGQTVNADGSVTPLYAMSAPGASQETYMNCMDEDSDNNNILYGGGHTVPTLFSQYPVSGNNDRPFMGLKTPSN